MSRLSKRIVNRVRDGQQKKNIEPSSSGRGAKPAHAAVPAPVNDITSLPFLKEGESGIALPSRDKKSFKNQSLSMK